MIQMEVTKFSANCGNCKKKVVFLGNGNWDLRMAQAYDGIPTIAVKCPKCQSENFFSLQMSQLFNGEVVDKFDWLGGKS